MLRSWWRSEESAEQRQKIANQLEELDTRQTELSGAVDSLRATTRAKLDSLEKWVADQAAALGAGTEAAVETAVTLEEEARNVWQRTLGSLPLDLTDYERLVAEQELADALQKRFELTQKQIESITGGS